MRFLLSSIVASIVVLVAISWTGSVAQDPDAVTEVPSIDEQAANLKRVPARGPEESRKLIELNGDFQIELVASEPLIHDPAAIDFDENGRIYVAQLPEYNGYAVEDFEESGSIHLLSDTDGDGRYDERTVFADKLDYPTAIACWDGGLFVGAAPDLLYLKDTDGDGKADTRRVVITGFGKDKAGEAHLNSIRWGFDNRFHFSTSLSGGDLQVREEQASQAVSSRNRGVILDPRNPAGFELTSGGGQHGMSMDNWGRKFVCSNSVPAQTLMYDDRYVARNPYLQAPAVARDIAPDGKFTRLFRISPPEPWRALRTELRRTGQFRGSDEGGKPFGFFTGATGITVYRGDAWPQKYHGNLLVGDVANNLVYRATLETDGLGLVARRADEDREFLASRDIWFRPVQMANAPDGTLYILDICRELIEGAAFLPPEFLKYLDPVSGNDRGRIYRIAPRGFKQPPPPRLGDASSQELVSLLENSNGWHRDTASRLLYQRQDATVTAELEKVALTSDLAEGRMAALYSLDGLGTLSERILLQALADHAPLVRHHALQLTESQLATSPGLVAAICSMTDDPDMRVRYQLAFSLGAAEGRARNRALVDIALHDSADSWMALAIQSSLDRGAGDMLGLLARDPVYRATGHGSQLLVNLAGQIGKANRSNEIARVITTLGELGEDDASLSKQLVEALLVSQQGEARDRILAAAGGKAAGILMQLLAEATAVASDDKQPAEKRSEAIRSLQLASLDEIKPLIARLLDFRQPGSVQAAALETLGDYSQPAAASLILDNWQGMSPSLRATAAETLMSRPSWVHLLLDAIQQNRIKRGDLDPLRVELLKQHPDAALAKRVMQLFGDASLARRQEVIQQYQPALSAEGDPTTGKLVFKKVCSACHKLEGVGQDVGADLKAVRNRGLAAVMLNVLDPNREVKPMYLTYILITDDGRSLTGMIQQENANSLQIRRPDGTTVDVQRNQIDAIRSSGLSFMPEGLEKQLDLQAMADLLAYLDSIR